VSRSNLWLTQPPTETITDALFLRVNRPRLEALSDTDVKKYGTILLIPMCLHTVAITIRTLQILPTLILVFQRLLSFIQVSFENLGRNSRLFLHLHKICLTTLSVKAESAWHVSYYLSNYTRPRWWMMMSAEQSLKWLAEETCSSATLSTTNPAWRHLSSKPGRHGGKAATSRLSYGTAMTLSVA
jgi:hypothetical protein